MLDSPPITWFTENPTPVLFACGAVAMVLLLRFFKTGHVRSLLPILGVAAFAGAAVLVDYLVVTDREQVQNVIYGAAADAERNDLDAVMKFISPGASTVREDLKRWVGKTKLSLVKIAQLDVHVDIEANPPTATARFWVRAEGEAHNETAIYHNYVGRLIVDFRREGEKWLVVRYQRE
jgi:hypothetical protein